MKTIKWIGALFCLSLWAAAQTSLAQTSTVVIAEIMYDNPLLDNEPVRPGMNGEYISLYNYGDNDVNIGGWRIEIKDILSLSRYTYIVSTNRVLPSRSLTILASCSSSGFNIGTFYGITKPAESRCVVLYTSNLAFPDTRSNVSIYNAQNELEDELTYDGRTMAIPGQTPLRATNNVNSARPLSQTLSIQRQKIEVIGGRRTISRADYDVSTLQLFKYAPEEYSYIITRSIDSTLSPKELTLRGIVDKNSDVRASTIKSTQVISAGKTDYWAENEIVLNPGFEVAAGAEFKAGISRDSLNHVAMLTYNLGERTSIYDTHGLWIKKFKADVVSLQEVRGLIPFGTLKNKCGLSGEMFGPEWPGVYGIGMLWNKYVVGEPIELKCKRMKTKNDGSDGKRGFMVAEFKDFCFVATHYSLNETHQSEMSSAILAHSLVQKCINAGKPVYIAGDMNKSAKYAQSSEALSKLINAEFTILNNVSDSAHSTRPQDGYEKGFIDLIFEHNTNPYHKTIWRGIPVPREKLEYWQDKAKYTDHFPYLVRVKIK